METGKTSGATSLLSKKVKIEGNIQGDEDLRVEGHFKGTIKVVGDFYVGQSGVVEADVEADNIVIQGQITGNVLAAGMSALWISRTLGRLQAGTLRAART